MAKLNSLKKASLNNWQQVGVVAVIYASKLFARVQGALEGQTFDGKTKMLRGL